MREIFPDLTKLSYDFFIYIMAAAVIYRNKQLH